MRVTILTWKEKGFKVFKSTMKTDQGTIWKYLVGLYAKIIKVVFPFNFCTILDRYTILETSQTKSKADESSQNRQ